MISQQKSLLRLFDITQSLSINQIQHVLPLLTKFRRVANRLVLIRNDALGKVRRKVSDDLARMLGHHQNMGAQQQSFIDIVGDEEDRFTGLDPEVPDQRLHLFASQGIQRPKGSSISRISGLLISELAILARWRIPPESS